MSKVLMSFWTENVCPLVKSAIYIYGKRPHPLNVAAIIRIKIIPKIIFAAKGINPINVVGRRIIPKRNI